jgi:hypothetical protein
MGINIVYKTWVRKSLTKFGLNPLDIHITREEASDSIAPRDTQVSGETPSWAHGKFCRRGKPGLIVACALSVRHRERHTGTEESLDEVTSSGRVDVEGMTGKKGRGCEIMCAELLGDGVD